MLAEVFLAFSRTLILAKLLASLTPITTSSASAPEFTLAACISAAPHLLLPFDDCEPS